tara:strand:- start:8667 stop:9617 length:951 start_codon:yes stop_codon:yes gene_type:complete
MKSLEKSIILIAPTAKNSSLHIRKKYQELKKGAHDFNMSNVDVLYAFFPASLIIMNCRHLIIRESISLYPFLLLLTVLSKTYYLEINGDPIPGTKLPYIFKNFLSLLRKLFFKLNHKANIIAYSKSEAKVLPRKKYVLTCNVTSQSLNNKTLPRKKSVVMLIGLNSSYHGLNKLEILAKHFHDYTFHIFGANESLNMSNIFFYDYQDSELIFKNYDFGYAIGSLNYKAKKNNIRDNSSLKGVMYHQNDLPFIQSYEENFCASKFVLNIPTFAGIKNELESIENFFYYWKNRNLTQSDLDVFLPIHFWHRINKFEGN